MRLIDADDIDFIRGIDATDGLDYVRRYSIDRMPTIDAVPVMHGEWITKGQDIFCSVCGNESAYTWQGSSKFSNYCPNCGAKMEA